MNKEKERRQSMGLPGEPEKIKEILGKRAKKLTQKIAEVLKAKKKDIK